MNMRVAFKNTLFIFGIASILLFCVNATAGITYVTDSADRLLSEPLNMALFGIGLIGIGSLVKNRLS
jgi:hypothetical protein